MTENDLVELYCTIDDFYQCFIKTEPGKKNLAEYYGKHGPKRSMTVPQLMTLNIVRILDRTGDLKSFHKIASLHYRSYFPNLKNYENFMKASNKAVGFIAAFIQVQLYLNQENCNENTFFSTQHLLQSLKTDIFHHIKPRRQLPAEANPQHLMLSLIYFSNLKNIMMTIKLKRSQKK